MKPRKLLFVITKATWGGAQKYVFDLATTLPKDRFEVSLAYGQPGTLSEELAAAGLPTYYLAPLNRDVSLLSDILSFKELIRCFRFAKPDIVHLNSSKAAALGALAARLCGIRSIVFTAHGWPFKEERHPLARAVIYLISWITALMSTSVIVVSKTDEAMGKRFWLAGHKIHYVPLLIHTPDFLPREKAAATLGAVSTWPRLVSNSELTKNKGIRYAIEAVALLKQRGMDVSYTVISDGEERTSLQRLIEERDVSDRVQLLGFVKDAARYLKAFDVFVLPSVKEGMPYVLLEAAASQLPIVTTTVVDPTFTSAYQNLRAVPPRSAEALADAIADALQIKQEKPLFPTETRELAEMVRETATWY